MQQFGIFVAIALALGGCNQEVVDQVKDARDQALQHVNEAAGQAQKVASDAADKASEAASGLANLTGHQLDKGIERACGWQVDADINKVKATMLQTLSRDCGKKEDKEEESCLHDGTEGINKTLTSQRQGMLEGCKEAVHRAPGDYQSAISEWSEQSTKAIQENVQGKVNEIVNFFSIADAPLLIRKGTGASAPVMVGFAALASITSMGVVLAWRRATSAAIRDGAEELLPIISESDAA